MDGYQPRHETLKRKPDFRVKYDLIPLDNSLYPVLYQGFQFHFHYPNDGKMKNSHYIIWLEFEDEGGFIIFDKWLRIESSGTARIWISNENLIEYHRKHLKPGMIAYLTRGNQDVAVCEVIELDNIHITI